MDADDLDLTSSGPMLVPGTSLIAGGGKTGVLYVLNTANLGKESAADSGVVQEETISASSMRSSTSSTLIFRRLSIRSLSEYSAWARLVRDS